jgi:hypothetical protein
VRQNGPPEICDAEYRAIRTVGAGVRLQMIFTMIDDGRCAAEKILLN